MIFPRALTGTSLHHLSTKTECNIMNQASYKVEGSSQFLFSIYILCPEFTSKSLKEAYAKYEQAIDLLPKKHFNIKNLMDLCFRRYFEPH